jgi:Sigma-54, DNA binding domain
MLLLLVERKLAMQAKALRTLSSLSSALFRELGRRFHLRVVFKTVISNWPQCTKSLLCEFHLNGRQRVEQSRSSRLGNFCKVNGRMPRPQRYVFIKNMSSRGIPIARRTVVKYRTELNIFPSNMRRKY